MRKFKTLLCWLRFKLFGYRRFYIEVLTLTDKEGFRRIGELYIKAASPDEAFFIFRDKYNALFLAGDHMDWREIL